MWNLEAIRNSRIFFELHYEGSETIKKKLEPSSKNILRELLAEW